MKRFYEQPTLMVKSFSIEDVLTMSKDSEDTYFNLNWISGTSDNGQGGF
jgi:hypothetical protein